MDNLDLISNNDDWDSLTDPTEIENLKAQSENLNNPQNITTAKKRSPILSFQLIVSVLILLVLFLMKSFFYEYYHRFVSWYDNEISASMIFSGNVNELDYSDFFIISTDDEI